MFAQDKGPSAADDSGGSSDEIDSSDDKHLFGKNIIVADAGFDVEKLRVFHACVHVSACALVLCVCVMFVFAVSIFSLISVPHAPLYVYIYIYIYWI